MSMGLLSLYLVIFWHLVVIFNILLVITLEPTKLVPFGTSFSALTLLVGSFDQ